MPDYIFGSFVWDLNKESLNIGKHGVDFKTASKAFLDQNRIITIDDAHSSEEERFFCLGLVNGIIFTVRFTYRQNKIRIHGAGTWRKGKKHYEKENK